MYVCADPGSIEISFAAVDDPLAITKGIEHAFQPTLQHQDRRGVARVEDDRKTEHERWRAQADGLEARVLIETGWNIVDDSTTPITIFGA